MEYDIDNSGTIASALNLAAIQELPAIINAQVSLMAANGKAEIAEDVGVQKSSILAASDVQQQGNVNVAETVLLVAKKNKIVSVPRQRAWTYSFDGHVFYVLDLGSQGDFIYDLTSQTWSKFVTEGFQGRWDFINGYHWSAADITIGGALLDPIVYQIDHTSHKDSGYKDIVYKTTAILPSTKREGQRVDTARLLCSTEAPLKSPATVSLEWSDNNGLSWSNPYNLKVTEGIQFLDWRSLGMIKNSGRVFNIISKGAILRLDGFIIRLDGVE